MRKGLLASLALILAITVIAPSSANPNAANGKGVPSANASGYWTEERRNNAIPREFQFEVGATEGKLVPQARKGGSGGGSTTTSGTTYWPTSSRNEFVSRITGKVFFTMNGLLYVCSGSLVDDGKTEIAVVITAAHCVWDNKSQQFATNFEFWPNYDSSLIKERVGFKASLLFAHENFTKENGFTTPATLHDFAFAVIPSPDSKLNPAEKLPGVDRSQFSSGKAHAFGYPASRPYDGQELVYSTGTVSEDTYVYNQTWRLPSTMNGGASGGPWYNGYTSGNSVGAVSSVNSYKYTSDKNSMYGPKFTDLTQQLLAQAKKNVCPTSLTTISCKTLP